MDLVRDLLDKNVVDRNGREMGRVDRIVLHVRDGAPPQVVALELGPEVLAHRLGPLFGRWVEALEHALGEDDGRPLRIRVGDALSIAEHVKLNVAVGETVVGRIERRLRRWVSAIPRSS